MQTDKIKYTLKHRKAFRIIERQLLGHNTIRGYLHDLDKIFLYMIMDYERVYKIHRGHSRHHALRARTHADYVQMIIDWECARLTTQNKQMNARETLDKLRGYSLRNLSFSKEIIRVNTLKSDIFLQ